MFEILLARFARPLALADGIGDGPRLQQNYASQFQHLDRTAAKATDALKGATTTAARQEVLTRFEDALSTDSIRDTNNEKANLESVREWIDQGTPESLDKAAKFLFGIVHDQKKVLTQKVEALRDPDKGRELVTVEKRDLAGAKQELKEVTDNARAYIKAHVHDLNSPSVQKQIAKNGQEINALKAWVAEKELEAAEGKDIAGASHSDPRAQALQEALKSAGIEDLDVARGLKAFQQQQGQPQTGHLDRKTFDALATNVTQFGNPETFSKLVDAARQEPWFAPQSVKADAKGAVIEGMDATKYKISDAHGHRSISVNGIDYNLAKKPPTVHDNGKPRPLTQHDANELLTHLANLDSQLKHVLDNPASSAQEKAAAQKAMEHVDKLRSAVPTKFLLDI